MPQSVESIETQPSPEPARLYTAGLILAGLAINAVGDFFVKSAITTGNIPELVFSGLGSLAGISWSVFVGYCYWDGDGDLSPHRDQRRHFNNPV